MNEPGASARGAELQLGALFTEALADGLPVAGVPFPGGAYLDVGTPAGYARALAAADPFAPSAPPSPLSGTPEP